MKTLMIPKEEGSRELIEGHPIRVKKIIEGDWRKKTRVINGEVHFYQYEEGKILYDSQEKRNRPWFILVYESGKRVID